MKFDFTLSFELNTAEIVSKKRKKGMITKGSDNYLVLKELFNQNYIDNEENRVQRPDGSKIKQVTQRIWDLENVYKIEDIKRTWVKGGRSDYKQYYISRKNSEDSDEQAIYTVYCTQRKSNNFNFIGEKVAHLKEATF